MQDPQDPVSTTDTTPNEPVPTDPMMAVEPEPNLASAAPVPEVPAEEPAPEAPSTEEPAPEDAPKSKGKMLLVVIGLVAIIAVSLLVMLYLYMSA